MEDCVFCKIARGEVPSDKIYEDDDFFAFLDINPANPGHTLVIPKNHYRWVWDVPNAGELFEVVRKVANALKRAMGTDYVVSGIAGDEINHAHVHVVPRFEEDGHGGLINTEMRKSMPHEEMKQIANKIRESF
jgi:histidine triad (HIT) family protein